MKKKLRLAEVRSGVKVGWGATLLSAVVLFSQPSFSQSLKELDQREKAQKQDQLYKETMNKLDEFRVLIEKHSQAFLLSCMKSFGEAKFCGCLHESMPSAFSFTEYVAVTSNSKDDNQYTKMDREIQKAYDLVGPVRDRCVAAMNSR